MPGQATSCSLRDSRRGAPAAINAAELVDDDRQSIRRGDDGPPDRRGRRAITPAYSLISPATTGSRCWSRMRGGEALELATRLQADRDLARRLPARHAGLDRAQPAEARRGAPAHSGADADAGRRPPARPARGAFAFMTKPTDDRRASAGAFARVMNYLQAAAQAPACWSRTTRPSG